MPKKSSRKEAKPAKPTKLPPLTHVEQQIMAFVTNNVAFENYGDCCSVEDMAKQFERTPGRFIVTLLPWVYPTLAALQNQNADLSEADAKKILKKIDA